jgi:hypothetical protein
MPESWAFRISMLNCPHCEQGLTSPEIGALYAAVGRTQNSKSRRFWRAKLTGEDANLIRESKESNWTLAEKYNVSFATISRIRNNQTHKAPIELKCPRCRHELTPSEIGKLFATLGGSRTSPRKVRASAVNAHKRSKLTEEDVANIRKSNASTKELARQYEVRRWTIIQIRRDETWKATPSE